ncbi:hypothetical protein D3C73_1274290 [compost metagenome]
MASPDRAMRLARLASMLGVCSQWASKIVGTSANNLSRTLGSSTSMLPVEAPMKTFTPATSLGLSAAMVSRLSLLTPK